MLIINLEDRKFYQRSKTARNAKYKLYSSEAQYLKCKKEKKNHWKSFNRGLEIPK